MWMTQINSESSSFESRQISRIRKTHRTGWAYKGVIMRYGRTGLAALATSFACLSQLSSPAVAADLPVAVYIPPVVEEEPAEQFDWDRFYAGVLVGYGWATVDVTTDSPPSFFDRSFDLSGGMLGVTVGRNFLLGEDDEDTEEDERNILLGIEADIAWAGIRGEARGVVDNEYMGAGIDAVGTLRARIGVPLGEERNILPYLTAGLVAEHAYAELQTSPNDPVLRNSDWLWGYTVGGGLEFAVDEDVTVKAEYLYTGISGRVTIDNIGAGGINTANYDFQSNHLIRLGLNYHF